MRTFLYLVVDGFALGIGIKLAMIAVGSYERRASAWLREYSSDQSRTE